MPILILILLLPSIVNAQETKPDVFRVAIKPSEPWVMYDDKLPPKKRNPVGFSIDLWKGIAEKLEVKTKWIYTKNVSELLTVVQTNKAEIGISAVTIRSDREKIINFSTSMFELGLQIMLRADIGVSTPFKVLKEEVGKFTTVPNFLIFIFALFIAINVRWWADTKDTGIKLFPQTYWLGVNSAFWWSITMLITWDAPRNRGGLARFIDLCWHFTGLVAMSVLTGIIAAALTIQAVGGTIKNEKDLPGKRVAAVATDAPKDYLKSIGAIVIPVNTLNQGINMLINKKVEALVHDGPRLLYLAEQINQTEEKVIVLPAVFNYQNYGIVLPNDSKYLEEINLELLKLRESDGLDSFHSRLKKKWIPEFE
ncbi:transporter substrate-binding domain-containing protein [Candidatus Halobeggiatoa sp. HSG11]|nr:transporter substrate-binding domain-containing protein [Candidatus Halobeggiatoa sp. HSG11]